MKRFFALAALCVGIAQASAETPTTPCNKCHNVGGWQNAKFNHAKTGFNLQGAHQTARCQRCHPNGEYQNRPSRMCVTCHPDVHNGQLGTFCEKCHDQTTWRGNFGLEAHRRTNFPLTGRHAMIPCEECHIGQREKTFTRTAQDCYACHQADYAGTAGGGADHAALGFGTNCRSCHLPIKWLPAQFREHNACFPISGGPHGRFTCKDCHSTLTGLTMTGACASGTTTCTGCHTGAHSKSRTDGEHDEVPGYQYKDGKCRSCHHP